MRPLSPVSGALVAALLPAVSLLLSTASTAHASLDAFSGGAHISALSRRAQTFGGAAAVAQPSSGHGQLLRRDAYTQSVSQSNSEGEAHGNVKPPDGADFLSFEVAKGAEQIGVFWTSKPKNDSATAAYIMIHGKLRDGDAYWSHMNDALQSAIQDKRPGVDANAIVTAPQFFSARYNSGQYSSKELAWGDVNAWQAGDPAVHPDGTKMTSIDAIDALVANFADATIYPKMKNITVVGHGGGGQLAQRYASVAKDPPSNVHVRYIHGDPSSCVYFTQDRPTTDDSVASKAKCQLYNTWRYGFDNFTGTADGLKSPQDYFRQYISRDVVSLVGYEDVEANGDNTCPALLQGGNFRRDRNLSWWRYINTLARTTEDLTGFPGNLSNDMPDWSNISNHQIRTHLTVISNVGHNPTAVFGSDLGRAALFNQTDLPTGWRPKGWNPNGNGQKYSTNNGTSGSGAAAASAANSSAAATSTALASSAGTVLVSTSTALAWQRVLLLTSTVALGATALL